MKKKHLLVVLLSIVSIHIAFSQEITNPIGSIYIAETPVIAYKLSRDNLELLPTSFLIDKSYKIKIYSEFKHNNTRYYIIKVLNYFYGNDYIIKSYLPEKPLVATVKTDMPKMRVANVTLEELIADTSGSKFNITSIINNNEPVHISKIYKEIDSKIGLLLSKDDATYSTFVIPQADLIYFKPFYTRWESFLDVSTVTFPIKLRNVRNNLDLIQQFNLGMALDVKWRFKDSPNTFIGALPGISFSGETYNRADFKSSDIKEGGSNFVLTPAMNFYFEHKGIQLIVGVGVDLMEKTIAPDWVYHKKPNLNFGIGYSIINKTKSAKSPTVDTIEPITD